MTGAELFGKLPEYKGGVKDVILKDGTGLEIETQEGSEKESYITRIKETNRAEFDAYCGELEKCGFKCDFENINDSLVCREYIGADFSVYTYLNIPKAITTIIIDRLSAALSKFSYGDQNPLREDTELMQFGLYYSYGVKDITCDCGMVYAIRLHDNSLVIIDGGEHEQASDEAVEEFITRAREMTRTGEGERIVVSAWFCTHNHDDHMEFFSKLVEYHSDIFDLRRIMFNFPSKSVINYVNPCTDTIKERLARRYPEALYLKPHTGMRFTLSNAEFEVITTNEDLVFDWYDKEANKRLHSHNESTTIIKVSFDGSSILFLGDCEERNGDFMRATYSEISCDFLQAAHHCINEVENIYSFVKAENVLIPECKYIIELELRHNFDVLCKYYDLKKFYLAGDCTRIFRIKGGSTEEIKVYPVAGYKFDGSKW